MQEHYRLADGVREDEANLIFNNAARKVIKVTFKHVVAYLLPHTTRK
jgi:hypothetical protein